jgi:hypothetical protein
MMSILIQSTTNPWFTLLLIPLVFGGMGFLLWIMSSSSQQELSPEEAQKIDEIASAASVQVESSRARAMELLAEKLPQTEGSPELIKELETVAARLTPTIESDPIQPLVRDLVNDYQRQALRQSTHQFWLSAFAAIVGFCLILYLTFTALRDDASALEWVTRSVPGVVTEAVAVLFFSQAREARQRATELYDRLRSDSQQSRAIGLVNSIESEPLRSEAKAQLALHFAGANVSRLPENISEQQ